jgi:NAD(P)-dependent dehydrogenase (short-subunit alcohol dehydrogenase family)
MKILGPVLVTGASTGIGRAITEMLAKDGHLVYATARKKADMEHLAGIPYVNPIKLDVTSPADVMRAAATVKKRGKGLYGLVNNAGIWDFWPLPELGIEDLNAIIDVNVYGVHRMTQAMLPFLVRSRGRIVNISSVGGLAIPGWNGAYGMTKHALEAYSESLSRLLARYKVKVSVIEVGSYRSHINLTGAEAMRTRARKHPPVIMKQEVSQMLKYLPRIIVSAKKEPRPRVVLESIADALFSLHPRFRYCPCSHKGELMWAIEGPITRTVQANMGGGRYALTRREMHALLDKIWDKEK